MKLSGIANLFLQCGFHLQIFFRGADLVYFKKRIKEDERSPALESVGLDPGVNFLGSGQSSNDKAIFEEIHAFGFHALMIAD